MAIHLAETTLGYAGVPARDSLQPLGSSGLRRALEAIAAAFKDATAAQHIYEGLIAHNVPRDEAAARTFEMLYARRAVN